MTQKYKNDTIQRVVDHYGIHCFNQKAMAKKLTSTDLDIISRVMKFGGKIDAQLSHRVAQAVRDWAVEHGAMHYCHWFQPQTGTTAEKHESFLWLNSNQEPIEKFTGSELLQSEPDASSFPSGGKRSTFEARGYTAWDPSSPMFIWGRGDDKTLYIPSVFVSYHGEALDFKTPLLRSNDALSKEAVKTLHLLGYENITYVVNMVGAEQEFFLVDKQNYLKRLDLRFSGRTVFGKRPPKGQELEDHYFGHIPTRVHEFINDLELELYKLGVPIKTRHNEVAPGQFEVAPIFESSNIASDHNQLLMNVMREIALKHNLVVLFHEKPFAYVNGSGKHVNWSMCDSSGRNLLDPGHTPEENLIFLTFLNAVLLGIYEHADVLRASIASAGNDHRLGANEAPPAIISTFLGEELTRILDALEAGTFAKKNVSKIMIDLGVSHLQELAKDNTDRNRTSPFAFTGNKFEFRAVGSSASISYPITILNGAVTSGLVTLNRLLGEKSRDGVVSKNDLMDILKKIIKQTRQIRFEGNGYSAEWEKEAKSRGLSNFKDTPTALKILSDASQTNFLVNCGIFSKEDVESRLIVQQERYIKECQIELNCAVEIAQTQVLPAALAYQKQLLKNQKLAAELNMVSGSEAFLHTLNRLVAMLCDSLQDLQSGLEKLSAELNSHAALTKTTQTINTVYLSKLAKLRSIVDALETILPKNQWPYPAYADMLFNL